MTGRKFMITVLTPLIGVIWLLIWISSSPGEAGRSWLVGPIFGGLWVWLWKRYG